MLCRLRGWLYGAVGSDRGRLCCFAGLDSVFAEKLNIGGVASGGPADAGGVNATVIIVLVAALGCAVDGDISTAERGVSGYAMEKERGVNRRCEDVLHASVVWSVSAVGFCFCASDHGRTPLSSIAVTGPACIGLDCRIAFVYALDKVLNAVGEAGL